MKSNFPVSLPRPVVRALENAGIFTTEHALQTDERMLLKLHGFGPKGLRLLKESVKAKPKTKVQLTRPTS